MNDVQLQSQIGRLAACDEHLALIVSDVSGLEEELRQLRAEAEALSRLVSVQEAALAEKESALALVETERRQTRQQADEALAAVSEAEVRIQAHEGSIATLRQRVDALCVEVDERDRRLVEKNRALSTLEEGKVLAQQRADEASAALDEADTLLREHAAQVGTLEQELHTLRMRIHDRDRLLAEKERAMAKLMGEHAQAQQQAEAASAASAADLSALREGLEEYEGTVAHERGNARIVEHEMEELLRRAEELALELAAAEAERQRLEAALAGVQGQRGGVPRPPTVDGHVRFIPLSTGYRLVASAEPCPQSADVVEVDGRAFVVASIGRSPLPGDDRPCSFLLPR